MASFHGNSGVVKIGSAAVAEVLGFSHTNSVETVDASSAGDAFKSRKAGKKDGGGSLKCRWDPTDTTGQELLVEGAIINLELYPAGESAGNGKLTGSVIIKDVGVTMDQDAINERTFTYENYLTPALVV